MRDIYRAMNYDDFERWDSELPPVDEYRKHYNLTVNVWEEAKQGYVSAYKKFQEASAVWESFSDSAVVKTHLNLSEGARHEYDEK